MGSKYTFNVKTKIEIFANEETVESLCGFLQDELSCDAEYLEETSEEGDRFTICLSESGIGEFFPGVRYTRNGDGYPDEYEEEYGIVSEYVEEMIEKFIVETDAEIEDWTVYEEEIDRG